MAQDPLLGFPAHTLPYRRGEFTVLSTVLFFMTPVMKSDRLSSAQLLQGINHAYNVCSLTKKVLLFKMNLMTIWRCHFPVFSV